MTEILKRRTLEEASCCNVWLVGKAVGGGGGVSNCKYENRAYFDKGVKITWAYFIGRTSLGGGPKFNSSPAVCFML